MICHDPTSMWLCCSGWVWIHVMKYMIEIKQPVGKGPVFKFCEHKCWILSTFASFICLFLWFLPPAGGWLCGMLGCRHLWWRLASGRPATHPHHSLHGADIDGKWEGWQVETVSRYVKHIFSWETFRSFHELYHNAVHVHIGICANERWVNSKQEYMNKPQIPAKS